MSRKTYKHLLSNDTVADNIKEQRKNSDVFRSPYKNKRTGRWSYYKRKRKKRR